MNEDNTPQSPEFTAAFDEEMLRRLLAAAKFRIGDPVWKPRGYRFIGVVRSVFVASGDRIRVVAENGDGMLHIFNEGQLEHGDPVDYVTSWEDIVGSTSRPMSGIGGEYQRTLRGVEDEQQE